MLSYNRFFIIMYAISFILTSNTMLEKLNRATNETLPNAKKQITTIKDLLIKTHNELQEKIIDTINTKDKTVIQAKIDQIKTSASELDKIPEFILIAAGINSLKQILNSIVNAPLTLMHTTLQQLKDDFSPIVERLDPKNPKNTIYTKLDNAYTHFEETSTKLDSLKKTLTELME